LKKKILKKHWKISKKGRENLGSSQKGLNIAYKSNKSS